MIVEGIISALVGLICSNFDNIPAIPGIPTDLAQFIYNFLDLIFDNLDLLNFFLPISTIKVAVPLAIVIINVDHIYDFLMWVLKKIPMLGIE